MTTNEQIEARLDEDFYTLYYAVL